MNNELIVYYQNVNGLRTKTHTFFTNILNSDYDVICLSETNLSSSVESSELFNEDYCVYRRDRESSACSKSDGGGVLVAVSKRFTSKQQASWQCTAEDLWVTVSGERGSFHCIPPTPR